MKMKYLGFVFKVTQERSSEVVPQWGLVGKSLSASLQELSQMVFSHWLHLWEETGCTLQAVALSGGTCFGHLCSK